MDPKQWGKIYHAACLMDVIELQFCQFSLDWEKSWRINLIVNVNVLGDIKGPWGLSDPKREG